MIIISVKLKKTVNQYKLKVEKIEKFSFVTMIHKLPKIIHQKNFF